ncbi:MAG: CPBP family intramembrane glutamic endopeptidase, partial [Planctomycetota bacterium]
LGFALLHALTPAYFFIAFAISAYLGWLLHETENLAVPIVVHTLYDFVALTILRRRALNIPEDQLPSPRTHREIAASETDDSESNPDSPPKKNPETPE